MSRHLSSSRAGARLILSLAAAGALAAQLLVVTPAAAATPTCDGKAATIFGHSGTIDGTSGDDVIVGSASADTIDGRGGHDTICGGTGGDTLIGGPGSDYLDGGQGIDELVYTDAPRGVHVDLLRGFATGEGRDTIRNFEEIDGSDFGDWVRVGTHTGGHDGWDYDYMVAGREGFDTIIGGAGRDWLGGFEGNDTIRGGGGNDSIGGSEGDDQLFGGDGRDTIIGGDGVDWLDGGRGSDLCVEGPHEIRCERNDFPDQP